MSRARKKQKREVALVLWKQHHHMTWLEHLGLRARRKRQTADKHERHLLRKYGTADKGVCRVLRKFTNAYGELSKVRLHLAHVGAYSTMYGIVNSSPAAREAIRLLGGDADE